MKKTLIAIALAAMVAPAWAAEVVSSNIVGYEKLTIPANAMTIQGVQFKTVGDAVNDSVSLQSIKPEGYVENGGDWIMVWDPNAQSYTDAYYWGESADGGVYDSPDENAECLGPGWGDGNQTVIDIDLNHGQGFWTKARSGGTLTVSGEVSSNNSITIPVNAMTLVTSTYPGELDIQKIVPAGYVENGGDWIMIWDPVNQTYIDAYYWGESADGGVYDSPDENAECLGPGWGDGNQTVINITLAPGQGFWTKARLGGTLTFPIAIATEP